MAIRTRSLILPVAAAVVVAVAGLVFKTSAPSMSMSAAAPKVATGKVVHVEIKNYDYMPAKLTVKVGTKIIVTNKDQTAHTLTARSGTFDSGTINPGKTKTFTASKPGVYPYFCQFHAFMSGSLTVVK